MDNDHAGYSLVYQLALTDQADITLTGYYNEFSRNWFKLDGGGDFINAANTGDTFAQGVLEGSSDVTNLQYRNNNRDYISKGVELNLDIDAGAHQLAVGGRVHSDEMDRFQPVDIADQINGTLVFTDRIEPTGSDNRLEEADALALWAIDAWQLSNALNLNLALRYEDVKSSRRQYADPERIALDSTRSNDSSVWLPGVSLTYDINSTWQALAGVHRGFSPLGGGATEQENPETSINYEAGLRYQGTWFLEAVSFYSDFTNKTENCSNADPCSNGATSGSFNTGEATISGIELQAGTELGLGSFSVPVKLMYTYTDAKVSNDSWVTGFERGDELASVPANTFSAQVGLLSPIGWDNYVVAKYIGEMCVSIGCNNTASQFDRTQNLFVIDYISRYDVAASATMFLKVENLLNERAIVSRQPDGARPNKPRTLIAGLTWSF